MAGVAIKFEDGIWTVTYSWVKRASREELRKGIHADLNRRRPNLYAGPPALVALLHERPVFTAAEGAVLAGHVGLRWADLPAREGALA